VQIEHITRKNAASLGRIADRSAVHIVRSV